MRKKSYLVSEAITRFLNGKLAALYKYLFENGVSEKDVYCEVVWDVDDTSVVPMKVICRVEELRQRVCDLLLRYDEVGEFCHTVEVDITRFNHIQEKDGM